MTELQEWAKNQLAVKVAPARLELVRIVREHCYQAAAGTSNPLPGDATLAELAMAALDVPVEEMASWFVMSDTVLANIRLAMAVVAQRLEPM